VLAEFELFPSLPLLRFASINGNRRVKCLQRNNISEYPHAVENSLHLAGHHFVGRTFIGLKKKKKKKNLF